MELQSTDDIFSFDNVIGLPNHEQNLVDEILDEFKKCDENVVEKFVQKMEKNLFLDGFNIHTNNEINIFFAYLKKIEISESICEKLDSFTNKMLLCSIKIRKLPSFSQKAQNSRFFQFFGEFQNIKIFVLPSNLLDNYNHFLSYRDILSTWSNFRLLNFFNHYELKISSSTMSFILVRVKPDELPVFIKNYVKKLWSFHDFKHEFPLSKKLLNKIRQNF